MEEPLSEIEGCDLLARLFTKRGYAIRRNVLFREYGVEFHVDGWDAQARVGFEYLTSEDDDHDDLTLEEYNTLTAAQRRGDLAMFIIDEVEPVSAEALAAEAHEFLDEVADAAHARLKAAARRTAATKKKAAGGTKPAARRATATKTRKAAATSSTKARSKVATKTFVKKAAMKKAVAKKAVAKKAAVKKASMKKASAKKAGTAARKTRGARSGRR
ncbi:MAG: hypothetical protein ACKO4T_06180 [Planctomycetaceae bacterium]